MGPVGPGGFSVLRTEPRQPEPGHSVRSMGPEQNWNPVTGLGGSVSHGARPPVRTGSEGRIICAVCLTADYASFMIVLYSSMSQRLSEVRCLEYELLQSPEKLEPKQ